MLIGKAWIPWPASFLLCRVAGEVVGRSQRPDLMLCATYCASLLYVRQWSGVCDVPRWYRVEWLGVLCSVFCALSCSDGLEHRAFAVAALSVFGATDRQVRCFDEVWSSSIYSWSSVCPLAFGTLQMPARPPRTIWVAASPCLVHGWKTRQDGKNSSGRRETAIKKRTSLVER